MFRTMRAKLTLLLGILLLIASSAAAHSWRPGDPVGTGGGGNAPEGAPYFTENFDSYADGSQMHGQGGWKGWGNNPVFGALVTSAQANSAPHSVEIVGGAVAPGSDLVHEFAGFDSGVQTVVAWQYIPTGFLGNSFFIVLNSYDDLGATNNWSVQVRFDSVLGQVVDTGASGNTLPIVLDRWVELRVEIDLDANTQTFYYDGQMLYSGSWSEHVSGGGATEIGAMDLYAEGAVTSVFYDDIEVGVPPAIPVVAIPTAGTWGLFALAMLLAVGTLELLRRRRSAKA